MILQNKSHKLGLCAIESGKVDDFPRRIIVLTPVEWSPAFHDQCECS